MSKYKFFISICLFMLSPIILAGAAQALPMSEAVSALSVSYSLSAAPGSESFTLKLDSFETYAWGSIETSYFKEEFYNPSEVNFEDEATGSRIEARSPYDPLTVYTYALARSDNKGKVNAVSGASYSASFTASGSGTAVFDLLFEAIVNIYGSGGSPAINAQSGYEFVLNLEGTGPVTLSGGTGLLDGAVSGDGNHPHTDSGRVAVELTDGQKISLTMVATSHADPEPIPEPLTALLLGAGLAAIGFARRKKSFTL